VTAPQGSAQQDTATARGDTPGVDTASIGQKASRGLRWGLLGSTATRMGSFAMTLVLTRLLSPADFGAYAIALAATAFVMHVNDVGIIAATVQWRGELSEMAKTGATLAVIFSTFIYAVIFVLAGPFATLSGAPDAANVVRILTLIVVIDGITAVRAGKLMRTFRQDLIIKANALGFLVLASATITLAVAGAGAYSFAIGQVLASTLTGVLVFVWAKVPVEVGIDREIFKRLMRFGIPLAASLGVESILLNADYVIVGNLMGATLLGFYLLAFNVSSWVPGVVGTAVRYVSVAGFSRLSEESSALSEGVRRSIPMLVTGLVPIATLFAVLSPELVQFLFGAKWAPAAGVLRFLMILMVVRMLTSFTVDILIGAGVTRWTLILNLFWAVALVPALLVGTHLGGIRGAAIAHVVVGLLVALPIAALALQRTGVRIAPIAPELIRPLLGGVVGGALAYLVARISGPVPVVQLIAAGSVGTVAYLVIAIGRRQLRDWSALVRRRSPAPATNAIPAPAAGTD